MKKATTTRLSYHQLTLLAIRAGLGLIQPLGQHKYWLMGKGGVNVSGDKLMTSKETYYFLQGYLCARVPAYSWELKKES